MLPKWIVLFQLCKEKDKENTEQDKMRHEVGFVELSPVLV